MAWQDALTLASLAGVVVAIFLGRRKGRQRFANAISAARAEGHAAATAELAAQLTNSVIVNAGNTGGRSDDADVLLAALRRIAVSTSEYRYDTPADDLDDIRAGNDRARLLGSGLGHPDEQLPDFWSSGPGDRSPVARGVGHGEALT